MSQISRMTKLIEVINMEQIEKYCEDFVLFPSLKME